MLSYTKILDQMKINNKIYLEKTKNGDFYLFWDVTFDLILP